MFGLGGWVGDSTEGHKIMLLRKENSSYLFPAASPRTWDKEATQRNKTAKIQHSSLSIINDSISQNRVGKIKI